MTKLQHQFDRFSEVMGLAQVFSLPFLGACVVNGILNSEC